MDDLIKVYEEESQEIQKVWLNEVLDEKGIKYKNDIKINKKNDEKNVLSSLTMMPEAQYIISVYVNEKDVIEVMEIIKDYENAKFDESNPEIKDIDFIPDAEETDESMLTDFIPDIEEVKENITKEIFETEVHEDEKDWEECYKSDDTDNDNPIKFM